MATLSSMVTALSAFNPEVNTNDDEEIDETIIKILAKVKTIAAYSYRKYNGLPFIYPDPELNYVENFLVKARNLPINFEKTEILISFFK